MHVFLTKPTNSNNKIFSLSTFFALISIFMLLWGPFVPIGGQYRPGNVHQRAENRWGKAHCGDLAQGIRDARREPAVLHTYFDGDGTGILFGHFEESGEPVAQGIAEYIVYQDQ